jgi:hypothetical protein
MENKMLMHYNGVFYLDCAFSEKDTAKAAGFRWHHPNCNKGTCIPCAAELPHKKWWIDKVYNAAKLIQYADEVAKAEINKGEKTLEKSTKELVLSLH